MGATSHDDKPRPFVARFIYEDDVLSIKRSTKNFKGRQNAVTEQFPAEGKNFTLHYERKERKTRVKLVCDENRLVHYRPTPFTFVFNQALAE